MKKVKLKGRLTLGRETISKLSNLQMQSIIGGSEDLKFGSSAIIRICFCTTTLLNCHPSNLGCDTVHNCAPTNDTFCNP
jgi:hypothetical protein